MSAEYWQCYPAEEVHFHYPVSVFSKFARRWENDIRVTSGNSKGSWCSIRMYHFRQLCWCRVSLSELWGFQWRYRVSLHRNRKSVKIQRANQLMSRSLVLRLFCVTYFNWWNYYFKYVFYILLNLLCYGTIICKLNISSAI